MPLTRNNPAAFAAPLIALVLSMLLVLGIGLGWSAGRLIPLTVVSACVWVGVVVRLLGRISSAEQAAAGMLGLEHARLEAAIRALGDRLGASERDLERERDRPWHTRYELKMLIDSFAEAAMLIGGDETVLLSNTKCQRLLGVASDLSGRRVDEVVTKAELLQEVASARRGIGGHATIRLPLDDTVRVCECTAVPMPDNTSSHPVLVTLRDVTELAVAIQIKTDFVANASHELRTPISSIRAAADTLEAADADGAMRARLIGMIQSHAVRLEELIRDLLDLSKLESQDAPVAIRPVPFSEISAEVAEILDDLCRANGVELVFEIDDALGSLRTDARLLSLILRNLTENAVKFSPSGSAVRISARCVPTPGGPMDAMQLRIRDRGPGIPLAQQARIFERFFQVDAARTGSASRGTGLGLAIVKHAAKLLDGAVRVESVWGQGTMMVVDVPACVARDGRGGSASHGA